MSGTLSILWYHYHIDVTFFVIFVTILGYFAGLFKYLSHFQSTASWHDLLLIYNYHLFKNKTNLTLVFDWWKLILKNQTFKLEKLDYVTVTNQHLSVLHVVYTFAISLCFKLIRRYHKINIVNLTTIYRLTVRCWLISFQIFSLSALN